MNTSNTERSALHAFRWKPEHEILMLELLAEGSVSLIYQSQENSQPTILVKEFYPLLPKEDVVRITRLEDGVLQIPAYAEESESFRQCREIFRKEYTNLHELASDSGMDRSLIIPNNYAAVNGTEYMMYSLESGTRSLKEQDTQALAEFLDILRQAAVILQNLHQRGYYGQPLRPECLFLCGTEVRLLSVDPLLRKSDLQKIGKCDTLLEKRLNLSQIPGTLSSRFLVRHAERLDRSGLGLLLLRFLYGWELSMDDLIFENVLLTSAWIQQRSYERGHILSEDLADQIHTIVMHLIPADQRDYYPDMAAFLDDLELLREHAETMSGSVYKDAEVFRLVRQGSRREHCKDVYADCPLEQGRVIFLSDGVTSQSQAATGAAAVQRAIQKRLSEMGSYAALSDAELKYEIACTVKETIWNLAKMLHCDRSEFASTLMAVILPEETSFFWTVHLGDGVIAEWGSGERERVISYAENRMTKKYTYTTVDSDFYPHLRVKKHRLHKNLCLCAMTDGMADEVMTNQGTFREAYRSLFFQRQWETLKKKLEEKAIADDFGVFVISPDTGE